MMSLTKFFIISSVIFSFFNWGMEVPIFALIPMMLYMSPFIIFFSLDNDDENEGGEL